MRAADRVDRSTKREDGNRCDCWFGSPNNAYGPERRYIADFGCFSTVTDLKALIWAIPSP
jgi:hypothetical protein